MPYKEWAVGEEVLATDFNPNIARQVVPVFDSTAQRTTQLPAPAVGQLSVVKGGGIGVALEEYLGAGSGWQRPWGMPWGVISYVNDNSPRNTYPTTPTEVTPWRQTFSVPANRLIKCSVSGTVSQSAQGGLILEIWESGGAIRRIFQNNAITFAGFTYNGSSLLTPSAGSHTYAIYAQSVGAGITTNFLGSPTQYNVVTFEDLGPIAAPA